MWLSYLQPPVPGALLQLGIMQSGAVEAAAGGCREQGGGCLAAGVGPGVGWSTQWVVGTPGTISLYILPAWADNSHRDCSLHALLSSQASCSPALPAAVTDRLSRPTRTSFSPARLNHHIRRLQAVAEHLPKVELEALRSWQRPAVNVGLLAASWLLCFQLRRTLLVGMIGLVVLMINTLVQQVMDMVKGPCWGRGVAESVGACQRCLSGLGYLHTTCACQLISLSCCQMDTITSMPCRPLKWFDTQVQGFKGPAGQTTKSMQWLYYMQDAQEHAT